MSLIHRASGRRAEDEAAVAEARRRRRRLADVNWDGGSTSSNENCLAGMRCPKCGQEEPLSIEVTVTAHVLFHDEGSADWPQGDMEWDEKSACECPNCRYTATVKDFTR